MVPGPPELRFVHGDHQPRKGRRGGRANLMKFRRSEIARRQCELPDVAGALLASRQLRLQLHFDCRLFADQSSVYRDIADDPAHARHHAHRSRDSECRDVVGLLIDCTVSAFNRERPVTPVVGDRGPHAHHNFVALSCARLLLHVVFVWINVAFVTADRDSVQKGVGVVVRGVELQA